MPISDAHDRQPKKRPPKPTPKLDAHDRQPPPKRKPKPVGVPILDPRAPWTAVPEPTPPPTRGRSVVFKKKRKTPKPIPTRNLRLSFPMYTDWMMSSALGKPMDEESRRTAEKYTREYRETERAARAERRAVVRSLHPKARKMIGTEKLKDFVETGKGLEPGFMEQVAAGLEGVGRAIGGYAERVARDPRKLGRDIYDVGSWWINEAPEKVLGKYEEGGYQGGAAGAWDEMSTQEQIDTIVGGKSLSNVLQGQGLNPGNIARAVALAAMAPIPFGKGLPSLASVLLRAGMGVKEAKIALQTGKGLREALQAVKTPVLTRMAGGKQVVRRVRPVQAEDVDEIKEWGGNRTQVGLEVVMHAKADRMPTLALHDEVGNLRAVAAYQIADDDLIVSQLAGVGRGSGRAMMQELAQEASDLGLGIRLTSEDMDSHAFYSKLGMHQVGKREFEWSKEEAAAFARTPVATYVPQARVIEPDEVETLTAEWEALPKGTPPTKWYHGTTKEAADEIMKTGVINVGTRSDPPGAWLTSNPLHARQFGDTVIEVPEALVPREAERISAFGGMISSPVPIKLSPLSPFKAAADNLADSIIESGLHLPPELGTREQLSDGIAEVFRLTAEGEYGKDWYREAADGVMLVSEETGIEPRMVAQLFAIYSQAADTIANASFVFSAIDEFKRYDDIFSGRFPVRQSQEALNVLRGGTWEGRKRSSFYANILRHIPGMEQEYDSVIAEMAAARGAPIKHPVTVDRWVVRMFRPGSKKDVPEKYYDTFETIIQRMAQAIGWEPEQVQAAAWVTKKAEGLDEEIVKGGGKVKGTLKARVDAGAEDAFQYGIQRQIKKRREAEGVEQLFDTKALEVTPQMKRLANQVNKKWGGFTVDRDLTPVPEVGYSVTVSITETPFPLKSITGKDIAQFRDRWAGMLKDKRYKIGGFSDDQNPTGDGTDLAYLSLTRHFKRRADALKYAREQGQETVYEYATGNGIRTGLTRDEQAAIIQRLRDEAAVPQAQLPPESVFSTAEQDYRSYLDSLVRAAGKGKRGVTQAQREAMEEETLRYANRYHDDPYFDEFWRLYRAVNPERSDDIPWGEGGFLTLGAPRSRPGIRTLTVGDKTQQLPTARSALTRQLIERPADWTSAKLMSEESKAAALIRKALPTASAEARVARAAGRQQLIEAARANARMLNYTHDLPKANSAEDMAHFYWAQLPTAERNAQGLQRVRDAQAAELSRIQTGEALTQLESEIAAVKAQLAETKDLAFLQELEDLQKLATDLPNVAEDLAASLAKLDKVIANPPKLNEKAIGAVRALGQERRKILEEAGMLDPEYADAREGLLSSWLGLTPTGEEAYLGHRLGKVRGARSSLMPASPGLGRPKPPPGARQRNKLVLARSGRLRASTHVAAEDWQAAQTFQAALQARDDLALMGKPFEGRLPEGYSIVNPKGRAIPAHWKRLPAFEELDDDEIRVAAQEIMDGFLADASHADQLIAAAKEAGVNWDELRIVPDRVVKRYYGQFTPPGGATKAGKAYDAAVDFTAASIVFARIGYIPKNIAQNLIMSVPHQGPFLLINAPRAVQALSDPELRHLLHAEVGFSGAAHGIGEELRFGGKLRGLPGGTANLVGKVADDPARFSAFLHEAAAAGVISKYSPVLTAEDRQALLRLLTNPAQRPLLNDVRARAVEAMADFSRMTPTQRRWWRRFLIIPGWLWAGSRYPFHFAATHPIRSAGMAYAAAGAPGLEDIGGPDIPPITDLFSDNLPPFVEGIDLPEWFPIFGGKTFRTTSLSPVSTPYDIALALGGQSPDTAVSYANPLAKSLYNMAARRVEYPGGSYQTGMQESIMRNLQRLLPNWTFVQQEINPSGDGFYPEDESRLGRFFRELGVVPIKVIGEDQKDEDEWRSEAERLNGGPLPEKVIKARRAYQAHSAAEKKFNDENGIPQGDAHTPQERLIILIRTLVELHPERAAQAARWEEQARGLSDEEAQREINNGREKIGLTAYDKYQEKIGAAKLKARTHTGMVNGGQHDG